MNCPSFQVSEYGLFDSKVKFPHLTQTKDRPVTEFELEVFPTDYHGIAYIDQAAHPMQRGTFLCAKPGQTRHSMLPYRCYYIHMTTDAPELDAILRRIPDAGVLSRMEQVSTVFQDLLLLDPEAPTAFLELQSAVCRLVRLLVQDSRATPHASAHAEIILKAERYIQSHLSEPLPLEAVAAAVNLSPFYFHRLFTDFFGRTPAQYILNCRIANAKLELLKENYSLPRLISDCGFSSQSYFCYKFKQATGKTPLQYRREMLSQLKF